MFLSINLMLSSMLIFMTHPLSVIMILMTQTICISMTCGWLSINMWFSYILFLIMIGGMLIIFLYMTSIASNEKIQISIPMTMMAFMIFLSSLFMLKTSEKVMIEKNQNPLINKSLDLFNMSLTKYFMFPNFTITMMIIYLLIALIAIVKITNFKHGPIRQMN
uniref:NADH-ubiquinone oxidoreductase chain 6 n=1 Tax=Tenebrionoidea sp. 14 KM-2017 TaxID=2219469 RepID=A0A346RFP2_9CUCU|nr:NADH dehydrogenase subunit 6 [Tenebrionoidea sp. 14 KM-2017]